MQRQMSFQGKVETGTLYIVPTPIGNLEDMTFRAINILKEVDIIAAEDTRNTKKLCNYFEIQTQLLSYHEHNKEVGGEKILTLLHSGKNVAIVSDAGMPCISDPGEDLVKLAIEEGIYVVALPGANAAITAYVASGLAASNFYFYGFLSRDKKERKKELEKLSVITAPIIIYEAPHRIKQALQAMYDVLGDRRITACRELTKKFEEYYRGTISELINIFNEEDARGEFCIVLEGVDESTLVPVATWWEKLTILEHIEHYIEKGESSKEAIKMVAKEREMQKREVYNAYHIN